MSQALLDSAVLQVMRTQAALEPLLAELAGAARHGDPDRIRAAAYDAQGAGDALTHALSLVFAKAAELSAATFDAAP